MPTFPYAGTGGITLGGSAAAVPIASLTITKSFSWNVLGVLTISQDFSFQAGLASLMWYQVMGKCITPDCDHGGVVRNDPNCAGISQNSNFITMVLARSLADVCQQLSDRGLRWPIKSIKMNTIPAEPAQVQADAAAGKVDNCDQLIDVPFCQIPQCLPFCIDSASVIHADAHFNAGVIKVFNYAGTGGIHLSGKADYRVPREVQGSGGIILGGSALVRSTYWHYSPPAGPSDIVLGGTAAAKSSAWHYTATGGITLSGSAIRKSQFYQYAPDGGLILMGGSAICGPRLSFASSGNLSPDLAGIRLGGSASVTGKNFKFSYTPSGGIILGGSATGKSSRWGYTGTGGIILGGSAIRKSSNWNYVGTGGISLGGVYSTRKSYVATGGTHLGGSAIPRTFYGYSPTGGVVIGGGAGTSSPNYKYTPTGGVHLGGVALTHSNFLGTITISLKGDFALTDITVDFDNEQVGPPLPLPSSTVNTNCNCPPLPLVLYLIHNINLTGKLGEFLQRNALTMPTTVKMSYDRTYQKWRSNLHFRGMGNDGGVESWAIMFTWECTNTLGSYDLGNSVWVFGMFANQRSNLSQHDSDTRLVMAFSPDNVCSTPTLDFQIGFNTKTKAIQTAPVVVLDSQTLYDEIGMFAGSVWLSNPVLSIEITETLPPASGQFIDLTPYIEEATALP